MAIIGLNQQAKKQSLILLLLLLCQFCLLFPSMNKCAPLPVVYNEEPQYNLPGSNGQRVSKCPLLPWSIPEVFSTGKAVPRSRKKCLAKR